MGGPIPVKECRTADDVREQQRRSVEFRARLMQAEEPAPTTKRGRTIPLPRPFWERLPLRGPGAKK